MDFPLKVALLAKGVPNAPCGVESSSLDPLIHRAHAFLMHRVELKVGFFKGAGRERT